MRVAAEIGARSGVRSASLVMATPANRDVLADAGLLCAEAGQAGPNDLVIAVDAADEAVDDAIAAAEAALRDRLAPAADTVGQPPRPRSLAQVDAGLALISTPGRYAAAESLKALRQGMNVFLFSDNVTVEQEVWLKREAHARGLIVMGPDCGTAILDGIPLGFANTVRRGDIGLIGASGTGLQQVSTLLHRWGAGVSQVVGVGGRDLNAEVGGISMLSALSALATDPGTSVIVLISKPSDAAVANEVLARAARASKPVVAAFLGAENLRAQPPVEIVDTLEEAARAALNAAGGAAPSPPVGGEPGAAEPVARQGGLLRALYSGGTFAYEASVLLDPTLGRICHSLSGGPATRATELPDSHLILDLGDDEFTVGRPHPMIDQAMRLEVLRAAGADARTAVIMLDVVLGHGAAADPAGDLAPVIAEITARPDAPRVVAFVVGTDRDPQGLPGQEDALRQAGAELADSCTAAAREVAAMLTPSVVA